MPELVKVGFSTKDPELRAAELSGTASPHPFQVAYDAFVESPRSFEGAVHKALTDCREGKEWFRCDVQRAIAAIREVVGAALILERYGHGFEAAKQSDEPLPDLGICDGETCVGIARYEWRGRKLCKFHYQLRDSH